MSRTELEQRIRELVEDRVHLGVLATLWDGRPWARYVTVHPREGGFRFATSLASRKVLQIQAVPEVHLTFMIPREGKSFGPYVQIEGRAEVLTDPEVLGEHWRDELRQYFQGPDDPDYCLIHIHPTRIELMDVDSREPKILEL